MQLNPQIFVQQPYRWVIIIIFGLFNFIFGINNVNVPPIATTLQRLYRVDSFIINIIPMSGLVIFAILNLPANYFIDQKGIRIGLSIGSVLFVIGCGIQLLVNQSFNLLILGSIVVSLSQPFVANCTAKIPTFWVLKQKRNGMITIMTLLNLLGNGFGYVMPTLFVDDNSQQSQGRQQTFTLLLIQFILSLIIGILVLIFMRDKPDKPVSLAQQTPKTPFVESFKQMWNNKNFIILSMGYMLFLGPLTALASLLNFIMKPFQFLNLQISFFGIAILVAGIIGCGITSYIVTKTLKYSLVHRSLTASTIFVVIIIFILLKFFKLFGILIAFLAILGFLITPMYPLGFDYGCQLAFPVGEAQITGMLNGLSFLASFFIMLIIQLAVGFGTIQQSSIIIFIFLGIMIIGTIFYWIVQDDLKRRNLQDKVNNQKKIEQLKTIEAKIEVKSEQKLKIERAIATQIIQQVKQ